MDFHALERYRYIVTQLMVQLVIKAIVLLYTERAYNYNSDYNPKRVPRSRAKRRLTRNDSAACKQIARKTIGPSEISTLKRRELNRRLINKLQPAEGGTLKNFYDAF